MKDEELSKLEKRVLLVLPLLNERQRRLYLAAEVAAAGEGSISAVSKISGTSRNTITSGLQELKELKTEDSTDYFLKERRSGAGRKAIKEEFPELSLLLYQIMLEKGFRTSCFIWNQLSIRGIQTILKEKGCWVGRTTVANTLKETGYLYYNSKGDIREFKAAADFATFNHFPLIEIEVAGEEMDFFPDEVWDFVEKWWKAPQKVVVGTLRGNQANPRDAILYCQYPEGYFRWEYRRISATLRVPMGEGKDEGRFIFWCLHP